MEGFDTEGVSISEDIIRMRPTFNKVKELVVAGDKAGAMEIIRSLSPDDKKAYKKVRSADMAKKTKEEKKQMQPTYDHIVELVKAGKRDEAMGIIRAMTEREREVYKLVKESQ